MVKKNPIKIYDNGGKTFDRYTVIIGNDVYTMSSNPNHPQGVNMWAGKLKDMKKPFEGKRINFEQTPFSVQSAISQRAGIKKLSSVF